MTTKNSKHVLVLDTHRGIYFGILAKTFNAGRSVVLQEMRHVFYYPVAQAGDRGVYGLASVGPADGAKIGPKASATIHDVSKVVDCSSAAVDAFERVKW